MLQWLFCVLDIDECASDPCMNNGTCVDKVASWSCACQPGYTGLQCQIGKTAKYPWWKKFSSRMSLIQYKYMCKERPGNRWLSTEVNVDTAWIHKYNRSA